MTTAAFASPYVPLRQDATIIGLVGLAHASSHFSHLILPASLLGYFSLAYIARMTRSFMIDQLGHEYVTAARIKGNSFWGTVWRHAFPNILVPLITVIGLSYASLLEGARGTVAEALSWASLVGYINEQRAAVLDTVVNSALDGVSALLPTVCGGDVVGNASDLSLTSGEVCSGALGVDLEALMVGLLGTHEVALGHEQVAKVDVCSGVLGVDP